MRKGRWTRLTMGLVLCALCGCGDETPTGDETNESELEPAINGTCAAEGGRFSDHYDCETVDGPNPGAAALLGPSAQVPPNPETQQDPDLAWAAAQIAACSCSCCHEVEGIAAHVYAWDFAPAWIDSLSTERLAKVVGGESRPNDIAPEDNHGFSRTEVGFPTTDGARMRAFFERELGRRP